MYNDTPLRTLRSIHPERLNWGGEIHVDLGSTVRLIGEHSRTAAMRLRSTEVDASLFDEGISNEVSGPGPT